MASENADEATIEPNDHILPGPLLMNPRPHRPGSTRSGLSAAALAVLWTLVAPALALEKTAPGRADSPNPRSSASVLAEERDGLRIRLEAPPIEWTEGSGYVYPAAKGFGLLQEPGRPALPVRIERVAIPAGATPRLTILEARSVETPAGRVGPSQTWVPLTPDSTERIPFNTEDPSVYQAEGSYPAEQPVRLGQVGSLREQQYVELIFTPVLYEPMSRSSRVYRAVTVRLEFGMVPVLAAPARDPDFEDTYESGLVNAQQGRAFRSPAAGTLDPSSRFAAAETALLVSSIKYKLTINRDGIYRLSPAWVAANAPDLLNFSPAQYRIDSLGQQIPITVTDSTPTGTFSGSDYIEFVGQALTWDLLSPDDWNGGDYTDDNIYWLYAETTGTILRTTSRGSAPISGYPIPLDFSETIRHEVGTRFVTLVPLDNVDHWYQDPPVVASGGIPASQAFTINTPGVSTSTTTASIKVRLLGDTYVNNYHRSSILVNGTSVSGPSNWDGFREFTHGQDDGPANFAQSILNDGTPTTSSVTVSLPLGRVDHPGTNTDVVYLNWIDLTYGRKFMVNTDVNGDGTIVDDQMLVFSVPNPASGSGTQVTITGFSANTAAIYEITKTVTGTPLASPVRITGAQVSGAAAPFTINFQFARDGSVGSGSRRFMVATTNASTTTGDLVPAAVRTDVPSALHSPAAGVDWLVIANASLLNTNPASSWMQLLTRRASQGLRVAVVDVEDVYDEFSFGISDPQGIRDFVAYVYANWPRLDPAVPVRYVLMVGDGSFDYKNGYGNAQNKNLLSTYMRTVSGSSILGYMSDETYFSTVSGSDPVPDVYLGRWAVHSVAETDAVAQKVLSYETQATGQAWQSDVVFVADDEETFEQIQDQQINDYLVGTPHTYHRTYERQIALEHPCPGPSCWSGSQVAAEARDRIIRQFNGTVEPGRDIGPGAALLSYVGHGSWQNWGSNFTFLQTAAPAADDIDQLTNSTKLPFILIADCLSGGFAVTSRPASTDLTYAFGDDFLDTASKGAIGILAPSHVTFNNAHTTVLNTFFEEAYGRKKTRTFGKFNTSIQMEFAATNDIVTLRGYTLLADPAVNLIVPAPKPPTNVVATPGNHQVTVTWTASAEAAGGYHVYQATSARGFYTRVASNVAGTSFTSLNLTNCTQYYYAVTSVSGPPGFEGAWSGLNDGCDTGGPCVRATPVNPAPPSAPSGLSATDTETGGAIRIQWTANAANQDVSTYTIYWGTSAGNLNQTVPMIAATSYTLYGLLNGQTYYFAVSASNCSQSEGPRSPTVSAVPRRIEGIKPPNSISNLMISRSVDAGDGIDDARLQWTPPATNIYGQPTVLASQEIYSGTTPDFVVDAAHRLATVSGTTSSYIHENGVGDASRHYYLIVAIDTNGLRSGVSHDLPQGIDQMTLTRSGANVTFSWPAVTLDVDGRKTLIASYSLYGRATKFQRSEVGPGLLIQSNIPGTSVNIPLPPGTQFYYSVIAVDNRGATSPW